MPTSIVTGSVADHPARIHPDRQPGEPPPAGGLRLETVLGALRIRIVRELLVERERFGLDRPKSSPTHHFRALREAGLIGRRQYGLEARFPGLLDLIVAWTPG
ncbi:ArsR family transcriptional regulator [Streptosporangium saharense]|uniref:ArsR family transcriptional regulator n=1 Tax=Streptosporangium saharense TaxID=1706840 RepID=UPI0036779D88